LRVTGIQIGIAWLLSGLMLAAHAQGPTNVPDRASGAPPLPAWSFTTSAQLQMQPRTDLGGGGSLTTTHADAQAGITRLIDRQRSAALSLSGGTTHYDFDGPTDFGTDAPWDAAQTLSLTGLWRQSSADRRWTTLALPSLRTRFEPGADAEDGLTVGVFAGTSCRFSDSFSAGPGIAAFSEIEDDPTVFPILLIDWDITPRLNIGTGRGQGATQGPGLALTATLNPQWSAGLAGRYEKLRFRLDDQGAAPGGVGEDRLIGLVAFVSHTLAPRWSANAYAGLTADRALTLEDRDGRRLTRTGSDPAATLGLSIARQAW
jgi:hypothetical protein